MSSDFFTERPWPVLRNLVVDFLDAAQKAHTIKGFAEIDITHCKSLISQQQKKDRVAYSLIAYMVWCYGRAVDENKDLHAFRKGKKVILFDEVDVNFMLEKTLPGGVKIPVAYIIRAANKKTYLELNDELRQAMKNDQANNEIVKARRKIASYPKFIRRHIWRKIERNPLLHKKHRGTVGLTTVGMFTGNRVYWPSPDSPMPCGIAAGSVYEKVVSINDEFTRRTMWCITIIVNHDIVDGAPATRFGNRFVGLMESGEGLIFEK